VISIDELTGVQALERKYPSLPMRPGHVEAREFEYLRHGTLAFIINFDVATGHVVVPSVGKTRTEADYRTHIERLVTSDPGATKWHLVMDNLNIHQSVSLVRYVAERAGITADLGEAGKHGILQSMKSRQAFLSDPSHPIVCYYTPKHGSWLNQVEIWLSILVRKLLKRGSFTSVEVLREKVLAFIAYFNRTMAKPFRWTYTGKPLAV
jgi:putative transposase